MLTNVEGPVYPAGRIEKVNQATGDVDPEETLTLLVPDRPLADFGMGVKHKFDLHGDSG
jgi:hypothetical protein